jgi:hypothetical protein
LQNERLAQDASGDGAWHEAYVSKIKSDYGAEIDASVVDAVAVRSFVRDHDGTWNLRPNPRHIALLQPVLKSLRMFDIYRAVESPLVIYNSTRPEPWLPPDTAKVMGAYRRGLARDLKALEAEHPNVRVRTLDATHFMIFAVPEEVARDILSLTPGVWGHTRTLLYASVLST